MTARSLFDDPKARGMWHHMIALACPVCRAHARLVLADYLEEELDQPDRARCYRELAEFDMTYRHASKGTWCKKHKQDAKLSKQTVQHDTNAENAERHP
jgi:hypothetical protein